MALRPRLRASSMSSRYGAQALAVGARLLGGGHAGSSARLGGRARGSVDTSLAGFGWRPPAAGRADRDSGGLEIAARRLATNAGRLFDAAERPAQPPQSENLLPLVIPQDVGHSGRGSCAPPPRPRLGTGLLYWGSEEHT